MFLHEEKLSDGHEEAKAEVSLLPKSEWLAWLRSRELDL